MDTQNSAVTDIPSFKLAKVGKGRERKRGGAAWFGARGASSGFGGALGASGAGAGAAGLGLAKTIVSLLIAAGLSAGAWQFGKSFSDTSAKAKPAVKKVFGAKDGPQQYADTSGVIKTETSIPNSMGYVSGSMDGLTPEERAKKAAEAEAARAAEEAAAKKAADEESKKEAASPASNIPVDPATIASANDPKKGLSAGKFGKLGSSFGGGGGLSGGSGLSGGINRNFGGASAMGPTKGNNGSMSAFRNAGKPGYTSAGRAVAGKSKAKGFAKRQLDNAFAQSRQAMSAGKTENAAATAASAFDNNPGQGNVIAGPGLNNGARTGTADGGIAATNPSGGGPLDTGGAACSPGMAPDINGNCQTIHTNHPKNGASYQWMIDAVKGLLIAVAALATIYMALEYILIGTSWTFIGPATILSAMNVIANMILALGVAIAGLGAMIMSASGDYTMGGIVTAVGLFVAACGYWPETMMFAPSIPTLAAGTLIVGAGGYMAAANVKRPAAMQ